MTVKIGARDMAGNRGTSSSILPEIDAFPNRPTVLSWIQRERLDKYPADDFLTFIFSLDLPANSYDGA